MKKSLVCFGAAALAALLSAGANVRAEPIAWSYGGVSQPAVPATSGPLSSINVMGSSGNATGNSGIIIYTVQNDSTNVGGPNVAPDVFTNVPFNLAVNLTDTKSQTAAIGATTKTTDVVNFSGLLNASNVTKTSLFPSNPASPGNPFIKWTTIPSPLPGSGNTSATEASVTLGSSDTGWRTYTVDLVGFTSPGEAGGKNGTIEATVTITDGTAPVGAGDGGGGGDPNAAPEPASLLLAGIGLPIAVLLRRRLKKGETNVA